MARARSLCVSAPLLFVLSVKCTYLSEIGISRIASLSLLELL